MKSPKKILVIDDDLGMIKLLEKWLKVAGRIVLSANTAVAGLIKAREEKPDCILLDIRLPDMDGKQLARQLKTDPQTKGIPIIFITVGIDVEKDKGKELIIVEGDSYRAFAKPLHNPKLLSEIRRTINRRQNERSLNRDDPRNRT